MSVLTDLKAALEAKREAWAAIGTPPTVDFDEGIAYQRQQRKEAYDDARWALDDLLTDDTIAVLIAVAEAASAPVYSESDDEDGVPMDTLLYRWQTNLNAALAPLVKEADDE